MTGVWVGKGGKNAEVKGLLGPSLIFYPPIVERISVLYYYYYYYYYYANESVPEPGDSCIAFPG